MSKDLFKNLIEAVAALASDEVVKLLDGKREHVADAGRFLHCDHGFTERWLRHHGAISITRHAGDLRTEMAVTFRADSFGIMMNGLLYEPCGDGWSFKLKYPDRERTADSAQYLWKNQHSGNWADTLKRYTSAEIRHMAQRRQAHICKDVADAAWIAFDEGGYRLDLKCGSVERILDLASRAKARRNLKKMIGVLKLDGFGKFGRAVKVEGIPVFDDSDACADPECEFVKSSAETHGLTVVTGIVYSFGPGIYQ